MAAVNRPGSVVTRNLTRLALAALVLPAVARAADSPPSVAVHDRVIVYVHNVSSTVTVKLDGLKIHEVTYAVFGVWNYQLNLSSWLDTEPHLVEVEARPANRESGYCTVEVRGASARDPASSVVLAKRTVRAAEQASWSTPVIAVSLLLARPAGSVRPLWADRRGVELAAVTRNKTQTLVAELFGAVQRCDLAALAALVGPAWANQAAMEGAEPELVERGVLALLERDCVPGIAVADSRQAFFQASYEDVMAPIDLDTIVFGFARDEGRQDGRGNLFTPTEPIAIRTRDNREFLARPFFSYTDEKRNRRFVSRFLFERSH